MKILIIYAHPNKNSLNAKIKEIVTEKLREKHDLDLIDLYEDGFSSELKLDELYTIGNRTKDKKVLNYQERIKKADLLIFISPTWWYDIPAILKGFIDRVFVAGFAFRFKENGMPEGLLKGKKAILIQTYSSPRIVAALFPNAGKRNFSRSILRFCGVKVLKHIGIHSVMKINKDNEKEKLRKVYEIGKFIY